MTTAVVKKKWYQIPVVWLIIAIPLVAFIRGGFMLWIAMTTHDGLVEDDYYKKGKAINQQLERDQFAFDNGIKADVVIESELGAVSVALTHIGSYALPEQLGLTFSHPTRGNMDHKLLLEQGPDGRYFAQLEQGLSHGRWYVIITAQDFRIQHLIDWPKETSFSIKFNE